MKQTFSHEHLLIVCGEARIEEAERGGAVLHEKTAQCTYLYCSDASILSMYSTPISNNRQNYSSLIFNLCVFR